MSKEFRHITRISETDLDGTLKVAYAISKIKGIGINVANAIVKKGGVNPETRLGFLSEQDLRKLEEIIKDASKYNLPPWLFNRQKDLETGKNRHIIGSSLVLQTRLHHFRYELMAVKAG